MIHLRNVKSYCKEFENIENYQEAISSPEKWDCHHRLEGTGLSKKDLIDKGMYYNRPAGELIFLTHEDHIRLHTKGKEGSMRGKHHSIETKKKMSNSKEGENNPMYGKHHSIEAKKKLSDALKGRVFSDEVKKKISDALKGRVFSDEVKKKMSDTKKGENNPRYVHICPALLQMMYIEQRKSAYKISQEMGMSQKVILRRLRELNIPIRKR